MKALEIAKTIGEAQKNRTLLPAFTTAHPELTVETAYQVQDILMEEALARGETIVGYKMGLTSRAKQQDVGVYSAIHGFLVGSGSLSKGSVVPSARFRQPRVEPEIAVILDRTLTEPVPTLSSVRAALRWVGPAAELLDSRYENYQFKLPDVIADNTSANAFILGSSQWIDQLEEMRLFGVQLKKNGQRIDTGCAAATFGDPLLSVLELIQELGKRGKRLEAGQVVLTGGITASTPLAPGDFIEILWPGETLSFSYV